MAKTDADIARGLDELVPTIGGVSNKVEALFGHQSKTLDAIRRARKERKLSYKQIAVYLSGILPDGQSISPGAVSSWLDKQGIR